MSRWGRELPRAPRTDPYMRLSLIRLLPRVRTHHQIHDDTHAAIACDMLNPAQCPEHALMARMRPRRRRSRRPGDRRNRRRTAWRSDSWFRSLAPTEALLPLRMQAVLAIRCHAR